MADASSSDKPKQTPSAGNGGSGPNYTWTQTLSELTLSANVPPQTPSKAIDCRITDTRIHLQVRGSDEAIVSGDLSHAVRTDESFWQIDKEEGCVTLHLEKKDDMNWWSCVIDGHPEIDISKVEPGNSRLGDLDGETRGMVEKMMYDQRQKAAGLPTSEEQNKLQMLEKFKSQHPEMDFSNVKFQ